MHRPEVFKGRHLGGSSDLTLLAPIKPGFIDSLESVTYGTRARRVLTLLHEVRRGSHEHALARLLSDAVERVGAIQSARVAIFEPENAILLSVSFDGPWEAYLRVLWQKVGALLDLFFCNTAGHVPAATSSFESWLQWARSVQRESLLYFGPTQTTAPDLVYLRRLERRRVRDGDDALVALRTAMPTAEQAAERVLDGPTVDEPHRLAVSTPRATYERLRSGVHGMVVLYRLTELYLPGTPDGDFGWRAARELLSEFVYDAYRYEPELVSAFKRFPRERLWLLPPVLPQPPRVKPPALVGAIPDVVRRDVQGGILHGYDGLTHGMALLLTFRSAASAGEFLDAVVPQLTRDTDAAAGGSHPVEEGMVVRNLSLTMQGLRLLGVGDAELAQFPEEFRQGMEARAGLLGDVHANHPRRWSLPPVFDSAKFAQVPGQQVPMESMHALMLVRTQATGVPLEAEDDFAHPDHPLHKELRTLVTLPGVDVRAVQVLRRHYRTVNGQRVILDSFGTADGNGQPELEATALPAEGNRVRLGEVLRGHPNDAFEASNPGPATPSGDDGWLHNGSFLVVRNYRTHADRLFEAADMAATANQLTREQVLEKLIGRDRDGRPATLPRNAPVLANPNDFNYGDDPKGVNCPLHAHVRRAHPRTPPNDKWPGGRAPRIIRRSMAWGPPAAREPTVDDEADSKVNAQPRGLLFMAYGADLGQQFEVVQRWLAGGNSTGGYSGQVCPLVGVAEPGHRRIFQFEAPTGAVRVELDGSDAVFEHDPPAVARLLWGLYLFAPSLSSLHRLAAQALTVANRAHFKPPWDAARGCRAIEALRTIETQQDFEASKQAWKAALEDQEAVDRFDAASIWASIREHHGGVLRTPYGVLVGERELALRLLGPQRAASSVCGQLPRMEGSFGRIYLGLDDGAEYRHLSTKVNAAISKLKSRDAFNLARRAAQMKLDAIVEQALGDAREGDAPTFETIVEPRELIDEVLAVLCEAWFGLSEQGKHFKRGGTDWDWRPGQAPSYPGHFTAISRHIFQPWPGSTVDELGSAYGRALRSAMGGFVTDLAGKAPVERWTDPRHDRPAALTAAILADPQFAANPDLAARTIVGVAMGFIPTIAGSIASVLREWLDSGIFWQLRATVGRAADQGAYTALKKQLHLPTAQALQLRPVPPQLWRTASEPLELGKGDASVQVQPGDRLVFGTASCTHQSIADGQPDGRIMFGGQRRGADAPTHACPGYDAAIGAMLGTLAALIGSAHGMRASGSGGLIVEGPVPIVEDEDEDQTVAAAAIRVALSAELLEAPLMMDDSVPEAADALASVSSFTFASNALGAGPGPGANARAGQILFAWGDSWLDYRHDRSGFEPADDLADIMESWGYEIPDKSTYCNTRDFGLIKNLADAPLKTSSGSFAGFYGRLNSSLRAGQTPSAILLSGGGNDSVGGALRDLLNPAAAGLPPINTIALCKHLDLIETHFRLVLGNLQEVFKARGRTVKVVVHGYDYPIPRSQFLITWGKEWMREPLKDAGYTTPQVMREVMRDLIGALSGRISDLDGRAVGATFPFVRYVNLTETLEAVWPPHGVDGWFDEMHATSQGAAHLAQKLDAEVQVP